MKSEVPGGGVLVRAVLVATLAAPPALGGEPEPSPPSVQVDDAVRLVGEGEATLASLAEEKAHAQILAALGTIAQIRIPPTVVQALIDTGALPLEESIDVVEMDGGFRATARGTMPLDGLDVLRTCRPEVWIGPIALLQCVPKRTFVGSGYGDLQVGDELVFWLEDGQRRPFSDLEGLERARALGRVEVERMRDGRMQRATLPEDERELAPTCGPCCHGDCSDERWMDAPRRRFRWPFRRRR